MMQNLGLPGSNPVLGILDHFAVIEQAVHFSAAQAVGSPRSLPPASCRAEQ
jgi:hypothetical protein